MSTIGEILLGGDLCSQCLGEIHNTRRLLVCWPQMLREGAVVA
jgi:hypothetical protein